MTDDSSLNFNNHLTAGNFFFLHCEEGEDVSCPSYAISRTHNEALKESPFLMLHYAPLAIWISILMVSGVTVNLLIVFFIWFCIERHYNKSLNHFLGRGQSLAHLLTTCCLLHALITSAVGRTGLWQKYSVTFLLIFHMVNSFRVIAHSLDYHILQRL